MMLYWSQWVANLIKVFMGKCFKTVKVLPSSCYMYTDHSAYCLSANKALDCHTSLAFQPVGVHISLVWASGMKMLHYATFFMVLKTCVWVVQSWNHILTKWNGNIFCGYTFVYIKLASDLARLYLYHKRYMMFIVAQCIVWDQATPICSYEQNVCC